eukprot:1381098-Rhodomonas_salina.3
MRYGSRRWSCGGPLPRRATPLRRPASSRPPTSRVLPGWTTAASRSSSLVRQTQRRLLCVCVRLALTGGVALQGVEGAAKGHAAKGHEVEGGPAGEMSYLSREFSMPVPRQPEQFDVISFEHLGADASLPATPLPGDDAREREEEREVDRAEEQEREEEREGEGGAVERERGGSGSERGGGARGKGSRGASRVASAHGYEEDEGWEEEEEEEVPPTPPLPEQAEERVEEEKVEEGKVEEEK